MDMSEVVRTAMLVAGGAVAVIVVVAYLLMSIGALMAASERCQVCGARRLRRHVPRVVRDGMRDEYKVTASHSFASCRWCGRRFATPRFGGEVVEVTDEEEWVQATGE